MLTVFRSNRAEILARVLAAKLQLDPPGPFEQAQVIVNTWPTSRWLGEQIALGVGGEEGTDAGGIAANLRFPFPGSHLRQLVEGLLAPPDTAMAPGPDPWRANQLVWPLLELLPALVQQPEALLLRRWLEQRGHGTGGQLAQLDRPLWQLGRAIADAFDDYTLYRPAMVAAWCAGQRLDGHGRPLATDQHWQPLLLAQLAERLATQPFGLRVAAVIERLQTWPRGEPLPGLALDQPLRLFGLSSMAPIQVQLLQALSGVMEVELYLLTPCRDLWQRLEGQPGGLDPLGEDWLLSAPRLEARFGRLGAEFQKLLEGSGETQLGAWREEDLFFAAGGNEPSLLEQLQAQLVDPEEQAPLRRADSDNSLEFHACPGRLRQVQIVRDRLLQLMAADPSLSPRDILVMTPQVDAFAPLVGAVFGDSAATGVTLPWRLTDRSQQSEAGISQGWLALLALGGERLTASALEGLLACGPLLSQHGIATAEAGGISELLQRAGFRWGLDGAARSGDPTHSLAWAIDRLLLGLVLPEEPGLAPSATAPLAMGGSLEQQLRWLALLGQLRDALRQLRQPRTPAQWAPLLRQQLNDLFGDGGEQAWEVQSILAAMAEWQEVAGGSGLQLEAPVVAEVLGERLSADSGRFGHRSGALTISALEPMRAIPHRVIVLMGLDAGAFPRQRERPGFHLMEQQRQLGDPSPGDQDRYVLLESLLSARQHLLITWSNRDERTGEPLMPSTPVRQWLALLEQEQLPMPLREHAPNPLERRNFLSDGPWPAASCDRRLLQARQLLEQQASQPPQALALGARPQPEPRAVNDPYADLQRWLMTPQELWLESLGLRPKEWSRRIDDLEALSLDERQRSTLLRQQLDHTGEPPDWVQQQRGRGLLPPLAAGELEARGLHQRWSSLQLALAQQGPEQRRLAVHGDLQAELAWRGDALVLLHTAKPRCRQRLQLWLDLLLAAAAGEAPRQGVLIARDANSFAVVTRLRPPAGAQAAQLLEQLQQWRESHRQRCWPVPPETGWAYAEAERKKVGSGLQKGCATWEGSAYSRAERSDEIQAACFGASLSGSELLSPEVQNLALALFTPLLDHSEAVTS